MNYAAIKRSRRAWRRPPADDRPKVDAGVSPRAVMVEAPIPQDDATARHESTLVIGYGNVLRSDDAAGPAVVRRLAGLLDGAACECMVVPQLMPELSESISRARRVIFVDASLALAAGEVQVRRVSPRAPADSGVGHFVDAWTILYLAEALFGRAPEAWVVGIGIANLAAGARLSPAVARAVGRVAEKLAKQIQRDDINIAECAGKEG